jgi:hypothetical protein
MKTLYVITKLLTLPGAYFKTVLEQLACALLNVPVVDKRCCTANEAFGHVEHRQIKTKKIIPLCYFSTLLTGFVGSIFSLAGAVPLLYLGVAPRDALNSNAQAPLFWVYAALLYLGVSLLCNSSPMAEDAWAVWRKVFAPHVGLGWKLLLAIPSALLVAGAYLERYCVTFLLLVGAVLCALLL